MLQPSTNTLHYIVNPKGRYGECLHDPWTMGEAEKWESNKEISESTVKTRVYEYRNNSGRLYEKWVCANYKMQCILEYLQNIPRFS